MMVREEGEEGGWGVWEGFVPEVEKEEDWKEGRGKEGRE